MKRLFSLALVCVLLVGCVFTLASCGNMLNGSYDAKLEVLGQSVTKTYNFSPFSVEIVTKTTVFGQVKSDSEEASYKIVENSDGTMEITFTFEDEDKDPETVTFEKGEDYIKLGGITYNKVK